MRITNKAVPVGIACLIPAVWLLAQAVAPPPKPGMDLMPPGAVLYVEARNFGKLLADYNASPEKKAWLTSSNYQTLLRSHLITRLNDARKAYLDAASLPESAPLLDAVAGVESAIGIYDIGKIEFLYTTRLNSGQFAGSSLAGARSKFETRKAGDYNYFIRTKGDSSIAYALVNDRLFLATREDLIARALKLASAKNTDAPLSKETWFAAALAKSPAPSGDVRMIADLATLPKTPQFRSYWIQQNITDLKQYSASVANLTIRNGSIVEDRVLLRATPKDSLQPVEATVAELLKYAPSNAGFYQAIALPSPEAVAAMLKDRLFGEGPSASNPESKFAPSAAAGGPALDAEDDFETRVDRASDGPTVSAADLFAPLAGIVANSDAMLTVGSAKPGSDQVLVGLQSAIVLHGIAAWNQASVQRDLGQVAKALWGVPSAEVTPLTITVQGNLLILSTTGMTLLPTSAASPASYAAVYRHAQELPHFERLTKLIDFPSIPQGNDAREPLFFSENIASLARSLSRLDTMSITLHDLGTEVQQSVVYKLK